MSKTRDACAGMTYSLDVVLKFKLHVYYGTLYTVLSARARYTGMRSKTMQHSFNFYE
eukprot:COSAG02_NODE_3759_length_6273_cov_2.503401_8_plen_57_part_00